MTQNFWTEHVYTKQAKTYFMCFLLPCVVVYGFENVKQSDHDDIGLI